MSKRNTTHILFPGMNRFYCGVGVDIGHQYASYMTTKARIAVHGIGDLCPRCVKRSKITESTTP